MSLNPGVHPESEFGNPKAMVNTEHSAVGTLANAFTRLGVSYSTAAGFWVALKSKPAVVINSRNKDGVEALTIAAATEIVGDQTGQVQQFVGHPWWAAHQRNIGLFIKAQERLTTYRLQMFLDEIARSANDEKLFFAVFSKISRAELNSIFKLPPSPLAYGSTLRIPPLLVDGYIPLPNNMYLLASIDLEGLSIEEGIFRNTCLLSVDLDIQEERPVIHALPPLAPAKLQSALLACRSFNPRDVWARTQNQIAGINPFRLVQEFLALVIRHRIPFDSWMIRDAYLYIGNSWDGNGQGLFTRDPLLNAKKAYDFWLRHAAIPRLSQLLRRNVGLRSEIHRLITRQSVQTADVFLEILGCRLPKHRELDYAAAPKDKTAA